MHACIVSIVENLETPNSGPPIPDLAGNRGGIPDSAGIGNRPDSAGIGNRGRGGGPGGPGILWSA